MRTVEEALQQLPLSRISFMEKPRNFEMSIFDIDTQYGVGTSCIEVTLVGLIQCTSKSLT